MIQWAALGEFMRSFFATIALIICSVPVSCNYRLLKVSTDQGNQNEKLLSSNVSWKTVESEVLGQCASCHLGQNQPDLYDLGDIQRNVGKIWDQVSKNAMPPSLKGYSPLSQCQQAVLKKWIDLQTPMESTVKVMSLKECQSLQPDPPIEQMPVNFQTLNKKILGPKCASCHCAGSECKAKSLPFVDYLDLTADAMKIWTEPGEKSRVFRSITRQDKFRMPPPRLSESLSPIEIKFIVDWIDRGKPEF